MLLDALCCLLLNSSMNLILTGYSCWNDIKQYDFLVSIPLNVFPNFLCNTVLFTWKPELKSRQIGPFPLLLPSANSSQGKEMYLMQSSYLQEQGNSQRFFSSSFSFWDRFSLHKSPGCHGTHFIEQNGLKLKEIHLFLSASRVLG